MQIIFTALASLMMSSMLGLALAQSAQQEGQAEASATDTKSALESEPEGDAASRIESAKSRSRINISQYVYQDRNNSGDYDVGDIAMSNVHVVLHHLVLPMMSVKRKVAVANMAGFANFPMGAGHPNSAIASPGRYRFDVQVPDGWRLSSPTDSQTVAIVDAPNSIYAMMLADYLQPVGLAPVTWVAGSIDSDMNSPIKLFNHAGELIREIQADAQGRFQAEVPAGRYTVEHGSAQRYFEVAHYPLHIGSLNSDTIAPNDDSETITFEDLPNHGLYKIPNGYNGLNWRDLNMLRRDYTQRTYQGYVNGVVSGHHVAYTSQARHGEIAADEPFDFVGVKLTAGWDKPSNQQILIESWRQEALVASHVVSINVFGPVHYQPQLSGITRVRFTPLQSAQLVLDDVQVRVIQSGCDSWWCEWFD